MKEIVRSNGLSDGRYVEPYAGGAAVAWELLLTGVVRRVSINDISLPVFSFWHSVLNSTDELCSLIRDCPLTIEEWDRQKNVFRRPEEADYLSLGFSFFFLNRTNRSGILNGGVIGGRGQTGKWKIDARFNRSDLISRIKNCVTQNSD
ncbi:DNA adenine methylase [Pseudanabaenaceae cyanobacterium LEGE 13415]|nr:DNA adenine methylase [Pseudanabaenaceae cyanobacterium LEGE 13415]